MELVYLWVEDYKNIQKQGFNFSPRFNCYFDGKELTICDKNKKECEDNNYIENFFDNNINVTAIVGKNGSGKSNVLEALICIMFKNRIPWDNYKICAIFYKKGESNFYHKNINFNIKLKQNTYKNAVEIIKYSTINTVFTFHYNYTLDYISNEENNISFNKLYHKTDNYTTPILLQPNKSNRKIDTWLMDYLANKDILNFTIKKDISIENIEKFFIPARCKLDFSFSNIYKKKNDLALKLLIKKFGEEKINYEYNISNLHKEDLLYMTKVYIVQKTLKKDFKIIKDTKFIDTLTDLNKIIDLVTQGELKTDEEIEQFELIIDFISDKSFTDLYKSTTHNHEIKKIKDSFDFIDYINNQNSTYKIDTDISIQDNKELLKVIAPWIDIEFINKNNVSFNSLSYGQKFIIKFLYSILNQLYNLDSYKKYTDIILLLDEIELGLHPQWQKEYLSLLIDVLKRYTSRYRFNIICSSHSPFIISDLPKENVIFLDTYDEKESNKKYLNLKIENLENGNCINVSEYININPFGANIHTLLSDGFFMEGGLMGEFAKEKIQNIIYFLKDKDSNLIKDEILPTIKLIGEPFLKQKLEEQYFEKYPTERDIDKEIDVLEKKLIELKEQKNVDNTKK